MAQEEEEEEEEARTGYQSSDVVDLVWWAAGCLKGNDHVLSYHAGEYQVDYMYSEPYQG